MVRLDRLDLVSRKILAGKLKGERRSKRHGQSVEFADYRDYAVGDDLRFIDWNVYARLERLFLKLFLEEEDLVLYVVLDISRSCDYGEPHKGLYMKRAAAALGYVGLVNYNRVCMCAMTGGTFRQVGPMRGRTAISRMLDFLGALRCHGAGNLGESCRRFALAHRQKGVCVVISDFFDKHGYEHGLRYLSSGRYDLFALHILSPQEIDPQLEGDVRLRDLEDRSSAEMVITAEVLGQYRRNLAELRDGLKQYVTRRGGVYIFASTDMPFENLVLNYLRERRLLG